MLGLAKNWESELSATANNGMYVGNGATMKCENVYFVDYETFPYNRMDTAEK